MGIYLVVLSTIVWTRVALAGYGKWYVHLAFFTLVAPEVTMLLVQARNSRQKAQ